jgi:hypothetical protein
MNIVKVLGLVLANNAKDVVEAGKDNLRLTLRLLYVAIGVPLVLLILGVITGGIGEAAGAGAVVATGKGLITAAGFIATLLLMLFWVRATVFAHIIWAASQGAHVLSEKIPGVELFKIQRFAKWLRGVTVWICMACLYAQVVPVWRHLGWSAIAATCILILSGVMSAGWFNGWIARYVGTFAVLAIFVVSTARLVSPRFAHAMESYAEVYFGRMTDVGERNDRMSAVTREGDRSAAEIDQALLRRFVEERNGIRRRAAELCNGDYCSDADRRRAEDLDRDIERIRGGSYWNERNRSGGAARVSAPVPPVRTEGGSSDLPPPPSVPRVETAPRTEVPPVRTPDRTAPRPTTTRPGLGDVYRECERYPELCG